MKIITVSREFGSGGREIGKRLADILGFAYYDREIVEQVAMQSSINADYIEKVLEGGVLNKYPIRISRSFSGISQSNTASILARQHKVIKELAARGNCVFVGRGADSALDGLNPFKIFVYADMDSKIERCRSRENSEQSFSDREYEKRIKQIDKARKDIHDMISPYSWGDKRCYQLCINTTNTDIKSVMPAIASYASAWFERGTE